MSNMAAKSQGRIAPNNKATQNKNDADGPAEAMSTPTSTSTTRVCVKNIPPSFDETKLKTHLQTASNHPLTLTDCKILKTKDGRSRKIAFVGFKTPEMAQQAVSYFNKSFALTSRLSVSLAFSKKEGPPPTAEYRPWSKHSVGSSKHQQLHEKKQDEDATGIQEQKSKEIDDDDDEGVQTKETEQMRRKKEEFLSAMGISVTSDKLGKGKENIVSKSKFWANDDAIAMPGSEAVNLNAVDDATKDNHNEGSDASDSDDDDHSSSSSDSDSGDDEDMNDENDGKKSGTNEATSDLDFLRSKQVKADILTDEDDDNEGKNDDNDDDSSSSGSDSDDSGSSSSDDDDDKEQKKENNKQVSIKDNTPDAASKDGEATKNPTHAPVSNVLADRLFVRNLPFTTTEEELFEVFAKFGHVVAAHIPVDDTKRNKGYAFISYESTHDAKRAMDTMDGTDFQGRLIHILPAKPSSDQVTDADGNTTNMTYKERQALARQKEAETATKSWSASFLRGDAVVDNLSDRLGVSKGDVLNVKDGISSGNAAVRLALGETHIISENIAFFENHGVDVRALESTSDKGGSGLSKRSTTMILVKNLPYDTSLEDLTKVFHGIGGDVPQRILLPPSKTAALVEYGHATDARRALRRLAYKKFKHVPLYLEWAPMMAGAKKQSSTEESKSTTQEEVKDDFVMKKEMIDVEDPSAEAADSGTSQSIYIKNLNFSTTEEQLKQAFTKAGFAPRTARIPTKAAPLKRASASEGETKQLSMGFGFVEFSSEEEAKKAIKSLQGKVIDGHALEIKFSSKSLSSSKVPASSEDKTTTKLMVRNVPFEATRSEILQLFGSFGQLKKVRLPKKFDGSHRGFAFCEFLTRKEAENAMATLSRTHLYGRHLVLEWASNEDDGDGKIDVGLIREKAKRDALRAGLGGDGSGKKKIKKR